MDDYQLLLDALFTKQQQIALTIITIGVMCMTQVFKNVYFGFFPERRKARKRAILWLAAFVFGASGGVAGHFVGVPPQPLWFWMFTGIASGAIAVLSFKIFIGTEWRKLIKTWINK
jgi:hypothetical protein